jgi:hypothetical protein
VARREKLVTIEREGRDRGKVFKVVEMPAEQAEEWAYRLLLGLAKAGVEVPEDFFSMSMAGVAAMGVRALAGLNWEVAKPLLDEMMECVQFMPKSGIARAVFPGEIEEVITRARLREEVIAIHTDFSPAAFLSDLQKAAVSQVEEATGESGTTTETSASP